MIICIMMLFTMFGQAFTSIALLFEPLIKLLMFTITLRILAIKFHDIRIYTSSKNHKIAKIINKTIMWIITDTSLVILCIISAILGTIFNGLPFYLNNTNKLISLFNIENCLNATSIQIAIIFLVSSITQSTIFCYIKTRLECLKTIAIVSSTLLFTLISIIILPLTQINDAGLFSYFSHDFVLYCFMTLPISAMLLLIFLLTKRCKLALMTSCGIIKIFMITFDMMLFPYIVPSSIDISQSLSCINSFSDIDTLIICLIFIIPLIIGALWTAWLYNRLMQPTQIIYNIKK